jgi:hypothetical protein
LLILVSVLCSEFCTRENWQTAVLFLAQEMELLALPSPCTKVGIEVYSIYTLSNRVSVPSSELDPPFQLSYAAPYLNYAAPFLSYAAP